MNNELSLTKIITGFSKSLNIANQLIPLYKQVKPIIQNGNKILSKINDLNIKTNNKTNIENKTNDIKTVKNNNKPTFFQ